MFLWTTVSNGDHEASLLQHKVLWSACIWSCSARGRQQGAFPLESSFLLNTLAEWSSSSRDLQLVLDIALPSLHIWDVQLVVCLEFKWDRVHDGGLNGCAFCMHPPSRPITHSRGGGTSLN